MADITPCPACKGHTANSLIAGRRVCCFCGGDKGEVGVFEKWCKSCRRMTPHRLADGSLAVADAYCVVCVGAQELPAPTAEHPEAAVVAAGLIDRQVGRLRFLKWEIDRGKYGDDQGH